MKLTNPPNSCTECGDGTHPGHELCEACEKRKTDAMRPNAILRSGAWHSRYSRRGR